ncbi:MAG: 4a-hydroxytetrahydrobiopterin dehydratase [Cyanobacteria bacterium J06648_16]
MSDLAKQKCVPCEGGLPPADDQEIASLTTEIPQWTVIEERGIKQLQRVFKFSDWQAAMVFSQQVGDAAEAAGHHPALLTEWGKVTVTWWTHAIGGLHKNDFVMAAKTDVIAKEA